MSLLETILTRRSIRRYREEPVPPDCVRDLLRAAFQAPSAGDARPWEFIVVRDRILLRGLAEGMPGCDMLREATLGIVVCADPGREKIPGFWPQDCACATQHILLTAHALDLGGCWIGLYPVQSRMNEVRQKLAIPEKIIPFALCSLGWPAEEWPAEDRFESGRVHQDRWHRP